MKAHGILFFVFLGLLVFVMALTVVTSEMRVLTFEVNEDGTIASTEVDLEKGKATIFFSRGNHDYCRAAEGTPNPRGWHRYSGCTAIRDLVMGLENKGIVDYVFQERGDPFPYYVFTTCTSPSCSVQ